MNSLPAKRAREPSPSTRLSEAGTLVPQSLPLSPLVQHRQPAQEAEAHIPHPAVERPARRPRLSAADHSLGQMRSEEVAVQPAPSRNDHISHWAERGEWPDDFFEPYASRRRHEKKVATAWKRYKEQEQFFLRADVRSLLARRRPERRYTDFMASSDSEPPEKPSVSYRHRDYATLLKTRGNSYLVEDELGVTDEWENICHSLLRNPQAPPRDTLFRDDVFETTCAKLRGKDKARLMKDLTPLLVPSVETLATFGTRHLDAVVESVNEKWRHCVPVPRLPCPGPQPSYAAGFGRSAFSAEQLSKLQPFLGSIWHESYFRATNNMHFPFLTCEVQSGGSSVEFGDRKNAYSMTVAMRGVVKLFKAVGRENELHRRILGFSISHNDLGVHIFGHYAAVNDGKATFWRHKVHFFEFTSLGGMWKWTAYTFTKNVYDYWAMPHLKMICSAIDELPVKEEVWREPRSVL